jgi:hypothetical protein
MYKEWLTNRRTIEELEDEHTRPVTQREYDNLMQHLQARRATPVEIEKAVQDLRERNEIRKRPFMYGHARWEELKAKMLPGDELWDFRSDPRSWAALAGREGVALVRDGAIVDVIVTHMS